MNGTTVGDELKQRGRRSIWGGLLFEGAENESGSITEGEGQLLYGLARALRPGVVLEVGTSHGFSGLHLAAALRDNGYGHLHTVEIDPLRGQAAASNLEAAGLSEWATFYQKIPILAQVDFAFLDAGHDDRDVSEYLAYLPLGCKLVAVHDGRWKAHVERAIDGTEWRVAYLKTDSEMGLALLSREAAVLV